MRLYPISLVKKTIIHFLNINGLNQEDATITAEIMIDGTLRGHKKHGVERIFQIIEGIEKGSLSVKPDIEIINSGSSFTILDANNYIGQPVGSQAMNMAINLAKETGISFVGVKNAGHLGSLAYYSEIASKKKMFGIVMCTTSPAVVVPGGAKALLGTNPLSYSFPIKDEIYTADFSTSSISRGSLIELEKSGQTIPMGLAVDSNGKVTIDPKEALTGGGLLPYGGGIRGALISMLISIMAGPLIGGESNDNVVGTRYMDKSPNKGDVFICIDIDKMTDIGLFQFKSANFIDELMDNSQKLKKPVKGIQDDIDWEQVKIDVSEEFHLLSQSIKIM